MDVVCQICGRGPAIQVTLRRHVGMIVMQRFVRFRGPLCREHGVPAAKDFLKKTLIQGWWGVISFFVNFAAVWTDLFSLAKLKKLGPPQGPVVPRVTASPGAAIPPPPAPPIPPAPGLEPAEEPPALPD